MGLVGSGGGVTVSVGDVVERGIVSPLCAKVVVTLVRGGFPVVPSCVAVFACWLLGAWA